MSCVQNNCFLKNFIWFLSTAKMSIILIVMMLVVAFTESPEQIENFLGGCITGNRDPNDPTGQNCTTLTLTKAGFQIHVLEGLKIRAQAHFHVWGYKSAGG